MYDPRVGLVIALAQLNPIVGHVAGNLARVREARDAAARQGADLVVFSELVLVGYPPEDLVLRPALVGRRNAVFPTDAGRTHPVVLEAEAWAETVTVALPEAFEVDELPEPAKLATGFGAFETSYAKEPGTLRATRRLVLQPSRLPVEQYAAVREFFEKVRAADQAAVVLAKK